MKTINAYQCNYCKKIYENSSSCKSHENRCYYNPKTRSCASCAFFTLQYKKHNLGHNIQFQSCLKNIDVTNQKLKTGCEKYSIKKYRDDIEMVNSNVVHEDY